MCFFPRCFSIGRPSSSRTSGPKSFPFLPLFPLWPTNRAVPVMVGVPCNTNPGNAFTAPECCVHVCARGSKDLFARNPEATGDLGSLNWAAGIQHLYRTRRNTERGPGEPVAPTTRAMLAQQFDHYWPHASMA